MSLQDQAQRPGRVRGIAVLHRSFMSSRRRVILRSQLVPMLGSSGGRRLKDALPGNVLVEAGDDPAAAVVYRCLPL